MDLFAPLALGLALVLPAPPSLAPREQAPRVVAVSVPAQAWLVSRIAQGRIEAMALLEAGDSPETYQPSDAEVSATLRAELFAPIGAPFEQGAWARALRETLPAPSEHHHHSGHDHDDDPLHPWLSPRWLRDHAATLAEALSRIDPAGASVYAENLRAVQAELTQLADQIRQILDRGAPPSFLVVHPAWDAFAEEFGLEQLSLERDGQGPSDAQLSRTLREARERGVRTLLVQPQSSARHAAAIAASLELEVVALDPLAADLPTLLLGAAAALAATPDGVTAP